MKYHVEIEDSFWEKRFPEWAGMSSREKLRNSVAEVKRIQDFLHEEPPPGQVYLLVTETGTVKLTPRGLVRVTPIAAEKGSGITEVAT